MATGEASRNPLPRWRGFNLLEKFTAETNAPFRETDFQWMADWGFNFVRLPMSYHCWSRPHGWQQMDESVLVQVDQAVDLGRRYGLHVCLNLHRAPGYCVSVKPPPEPGSLWRDAEMLEACCFQWRALARRYVGIPSTQLSFNLINEPPSPSDAMTRADHERVIRALIATIREEDPARLIIVDGLCYGNDPVPELADGGVAQSCRAYWPMGVTHYRASWVKGETFPEPRWPGGWHYGEQWDRNRLEKHYARWARLMERGVGVHCGEGGCFNETPYTVFLSWLRDVLEILHTLGIGYALWNFRGPFGILDSNRKDAVYTEWHGHRLDATLLALLQKY